jgi:MFS family permease
MTCHVSCVLTHHAPHAQLRTSYIARAVETRERTKWMSALAFSMLLGAALSPFITLACSQVAAPLPMTRAQQDSWLLWDVNRYTLVYLVGAALTTVVTGVTAACFLEYPNDKAGGTGHKSAGDLAMSIAEERWRRLSEEERGYYRRVQAYFALLFTMDGISQGMMSVAIYPVLGDVYNLTADQMSLITMVLSTIALLPPAIAAVLSKWLADRDLMALGLALKSLGVMFTLFPAGGNTLLGRWLFIIGYVFVVKASLFFLMSGTSNLTKQLGDQANPQNMSYNVMSRNFGNFLGMLVAGPFILTWYHTWAWLVISFPLSLAWLLLLYPYFWQRMDPVDPNSAKWIPASAWARLRVDDDPVVLEAELRAMRCGDNADGAEKKL